MSANNNNKPWGVSWELAAFAILLLYPIFPVFESAFYGVFNRSLGDQLPNMFIFAILALGLNVVVGYTGLLHIGIAAFFAIGAYTAGILTAATYPFNAPFIIVLIAGPIVAAIFGILLGAPTIRLRGDYLAIVTLGFGEVMKFTLKNLEAVTAGTRGLNPVRPPTETIEWLDWSGDYRPFYYLCFGIMILVYYFLANLEKSPLGRAWVAMREDELAANCMGLRPNRLKLAAFALGSALAGLAGVLYATRLTSTANPDAYDFNRSVFFLCCLILGGLGNRAGVLLGVFLLVGFDNVLSPAIDGLIQQNFPDSRSNIMFTFAGWRLMVFGLALILMMRFRPEGLLPSTRVKAEIQDRRDEGGLT